MPWKYFTSILSTLNTDYQTFMIIYVTTSDPVTFDKVFMHGSCNVFTIDNLKISTTTNIHYISIDDDAVGCYGPSSDFLHQLLILVGAGMTMN